MSTIKDVANRAGLSIATISKYLNGGNVLEENRVRIAEAIEALDYKVNRAARSLKTNRSMTVGVVTPTLDSPFFSRIVSRVDSRLAQHGYSTILCHYNFDREVALQKLRFLIDIGVDALMLIPERLSCEDISAFKEIASRDVPLVLMDRTIQGLASDMVLSNNMTVSYDAVEHLILRGHRRIGIIAGPLYVSTAYERLMGYKRALEAYNIAEDEGVMMTGAYDTESGYRLFGQLMKMENPPTALFLTNYDMMLGALTALYEWEGDRSRIPEIVGYDNLDISRILRPAISIVIQPIDDMGEEAANILLRRMAGDWGDFPTVRRFRCSLMVP